MCQVLAIHGTEWTCTLVCRGMGSSQRRKFAESGHWLNLTYLHEQMTGGLLAKKALNSSSRGKVEPIPELTMADSDIAVSNSRRLLYFLRCMH